MLTSGDVSDVGEVSEVSQVGQVSQVGLVGLVGQVCQVSQGCSNWSERVIWGCFKDQTRLIYNYVTANKVDLGLLVVCLDERKFLSFLLSFQSCLDCIQLILILVSNWLLLLTFQWIIQSRRCGG